MFYQKKCRNSVTIQSSCHFESVAQPSSKSLICDQAIGEAEIEKSRVLKSEISILVEMT